MKYRFRSSPQNKLLPKSKKRPILKACRHSHSLPINSTEKASEEERIKLSSLFEYASLEGDSEKSKRKFLRREKRKKLLKAIGRRLKDIGCALLFVLTLPLMPIRKWLRGESEPMSTKMLLGALSSVLTVFALSSFVIFFSFFYTQFIGYKTVNVPSLVGAEYDSDLFHDSSVFEYTVEYEYSETHPSGTVIEQSPPADVKRRSYRGEPINVSLTVSQGRKSYLLDSLIGMPQRDAHLLLKNAGVATDIYYEYSSAHPQGTVIKTVPEAGEKLYSGDRAEIYVSLGERVNFVSVPYLLGMSETTAISKLKSFGLSIGQVTYVESERPVGTVISQTPSQYTELEEGSSVSLVVSAGFSYSPRRVPDLYGMTVDEARLALNAVGLSIGGIFSASSALPHGTVISQSIAPKTDITPSMSKVDIYISS